MSGEIGLADYRADLWSINRAEIGALTRRVYKVSAGTNPNSSD